jgi:hypothetical protein
MLFCVVSLMKLMLVERVGSVNWRFEQQGRHKQQQQQYARHCVTSC